MKKKLLVVAVALLAALTALAISGCSCSAQSSSSASAGSDSASSSASSSSASSSSAGQVEVPNLVLLTEAEAETALADAGLQLGEVSYDYNDTIPAGYVATQEPAALTMVDAGSTVALFVSDGPEAPTQVAVPSLLGMSQADAEDALAQLGLVAIEDNPQIDDSVAPGLVCWQSVDEGTMVDAGTQVEFATAIADDSVEVPDLVGEPYEGSIDALTNLGLGYDKATAYSDDYDEGIVMAQSVDFGSTVAKGTIVTLTVSLGPVPTTDKVAVPNVSLYSLSEAKAAIESAGLVFNYTGSEDGLVVAEHPHSGAEVEVGTTVTVRLQ